MKFNSTFKGVYLYAPLVLLLLLFQPLHAQSTRVYATTISSQNHTDFSGNAVDGNLATDANVRASSGLILGAGAYSGHIELQYAALLPANTTSYVKITTDDNLLPALLGGSLGGLLSEVLGTLLIGNQEFTVQAKNSGSVVLQGDSQDIGDFATNRLRIVTDVSGDYYIAMTPSLPYDRIRLTNRVGSLIGLFNTRTLEVFDAFYISDADNCGQATYTSYSGTGLNLDLLNLGGAGVDNPENAIDNNPNSFSQLSLGILAVAASIEQTAYFDGLSDTNDQFNIRLKVDPSLLALGVANNIQFVAWDGPNVVQSATLGSLLNLDLLGLLQGNQVATVSFSPSAPADRITVRYGSLLNVQLTQSFDIYDIIRVPKIPIITDAFTTDATVCAGNTASLVATTASGYELRWYTVAAGGSATTLASGQPYATAALASDTSFYVAAARIGCPEESQRIRVDVEVITVPIAGDIEIGTNLTACQGNTTLTPISDIGGAEIKYYTGQDKTQEITTGYSGDAGVAYFKDNATGALTISGLNATDSPYVYYISLTVDGLCENTAGTLKEVAVNFSSTLSLEVQNLNGCGSVNLRDAILNFNPAYTYSFFDAADVPVPTEAAAAITESGNYYIQAENTGVACLSDRLLVTVNVSAQPDLVIADTSLITTIGNPVNLNATATGTISWYDAEGNVLPSNVAGPFAAVGTYTFTAVAVNGACSASGSISITVIDPAECPSLTERNYADTQSWSSIITGGVFDAPEAVDEDIRSHATITTGIGLLGIGTTWQTLQWNETIPAGTPVTLKLGSEYSGLTLIGGFSVVGTKRNGSGVAIPVGNLQPVSGSLLDLLPGQNTFEYTFVPSNNSGPQNYDGVRIVIGSLVSVAQNAKIFEAYYQTPATQVACDGNDAQDVLYGSVDLGIGVATATVGVDNAYDAIDASQTSYATMFSGAGILAAAEMTVVFHTPSVIGDTLKIRISRPGTLFTASVLSGIFVQPRLNNANVGPAIAISSSLLTVRLLNGGQQAELLIVPNDIFDRVRIRFGGVAGVLDFIRIHNIERAANTHIDGADDNNFITACQGETIMLEADSVPCTTFIWYDAETGGNVVSTGNSFTIPTDLPQGVYKYYIQPVRYGCEFLSRGEVTVTVTETAPETAIASVAINGSPITSFCSETGNVTLTATLNATLTITNPVFYWYSLNGTDQILVPSVTGATLTLTDLVPGTYTYFVGISSDEYCQTALKDRTEVTFTILPGSAASDIAIADAGVCLSSNVVLAPSSTLPNPQFTFYFTNDTTQPITNGLIVGGVTYTIANGILTISGLSADDSPYTYYVAVTSDTTCLNEAGNLEAVAVTIGNLPIPTTENETQNFCLANNPTIADIQVNEPDVIFYDTATGGNQLAPATALAAGIYYATLDDGVCQSITRLAVTVTIGSPDTPTTTNATQNFCLVDNPTVGDIQVNETGVIFYDALVGGNLLEPTAPLTAGIYYAAILDGLCESMARLAITITISDPATPTTTSKSQDFCAANNPVVGDIQINETNVAIYNVPTGGTPLALTDALAAGTYYVSLIEAVTNCESTVRLEIVVTITTVATPTTNNLTQHFCQTANPTVANIQVNEPDVIFYDAAIGGNSLAPTLPLVEGTYYVSLMNGICESETRLEIAVTIGNPEPPTTSNDNQDFCQSQNPTVADIQVNEAEVLFYDAATGGNLLDASSPLLTGVYYAAVNDGVCESVPRLELTVTISNPGTPTTGDPTQEFCYTENPTLADIQVNEGNVSFYDAQTGGNLLPLSTALVSGVYYAALNEGNCSSIVRLAITVDVLGSQTVTITGGGDTACFSEKVTYTTTPGMTDYNWTVQGGFITDGGTATSNFVTIQWDVIGNGNVGVSFTIPGCAGIVSSARQILVEICSDITITKTVDNPTPFIDDNVVFTITVTNNGDSNFTDIVINEPLPSGYGFVSITATDGTYSNASGEWLIPTLNSGQIAIMSLTATVLPTGNYLNTASIASSDPIDSDTANNSAEAEVEPICLTVYNEFSPNNDGNNDTFQVDCIENYPNNSFQVHNRYGVAVYKTHGYRNTWDGTANVNSPINEDNRLPAGTYYYIIDLGDGSATKNGWLYIIR